MRHANILIRAAAVAGLGLASAREAASEDLVIYGNTLATGWANWSWNTTVNLSNGNPAYGGSGTSISARLDAAWAGLFLHSDSAVSNADYTAIRFVIHGGVGGQAVRFVAYDASGSQSPNEITLTPLTVGWRTIEATFAQLGVATIGGLSWQDASGGAQPAFYVDELVLVAGPPPAAPIVTVDVRADRHPISPDIYGLNWAGAALLAELRVPVHRWGGNATTRYNWQIDTNNRSSDWYFENIPNDNPDPNQLPAGSSSDAFIETNLATGAQTLLTVPLIGWTPKARQFDCAFRVSKYGAQQSVDPWQPDCGNGVQINGQPVTGNDPNDSSIPIGPGFVQDWMAHLMNRYGTAMAGGVRYYNLDNEPMLWNSTHRDVHPDGCGYDELRDRTFAYAAAIKAADAGAKTLGPVVWGWSAYFYSARDADLGGAQWWDTRPDRRAHGDVPLTDWYLQQMRAFEQANGVRILDYLDLHYYPQASGVALQSAGNAATQALRLRSTRSLWDPSYVDESWIGEPVRLIPRMREWVANNYPGTKLAITEYNFGGFEHVNGALAQADVLGIFGREQLDLATLWTAPEPDQPAAFAFRLYRNYDGAGRTFGQTSVRTASTDQGTVSGYASLCDDGATTIVLVNKSVTQQSCPLRIAGWGAQQATAAAYRYDAGDLSHIARLADVPLTAAGSGAPLAPAGGTLALPASSLTLLVLRAGAGRGDLNCDGQADFADINPFVLALLDPAGYSQQYPACSPLNADLDNDAGVDFGDINPFVVLLVGSGPSGQRDAAGAAAPHP